jgi:NAD(P)H-flavin reductase
VIDAGPPATPTSVPAWLPRNDLDRLIQLLRADGRRVLGPTVSDGAIVYGELEGVDDLPHGVRDEQAPGRYRLANGGDGNAHTFDFASSPTSWKQYTYPPVIPLTRGRRDGARVSFEGPATAVSPMAFLGVRACDLAALGIQDTVLAGGPFIDDDFVARRSAALVIAVECGTPSSSCFCASMGTGPEARSGFDLALTELDDGFVVRAGTDAGQELCSTLGLEAATEAQRASASIVPLRARAQMGAGVATANLHDRLLGQLDSPRWAEIAQRCLSCTNCTMVCPTCFCTSVTQTSDLAGSIASADRSWDSCFTLGFASVAGGNFRPRVQDRYRQWLTHKFATWVDQFGMIGCVGCGRCITWCPVGIDVREELAAVVPSVPAPGPTVTAVPVAASPGRYAIGTVEAIVRQTADTVALTLGDLPSAILAGAPGQFLMLDLPGFSGVPISVSRYLPDGIVLTIRAAGASTRAISDLTPGAQLGLRGPLGRGWPLEEAVGRDLLVVAGGIGLAPLRPLVDAILATRDRFDRVRLCYGSRTPGDMLFAGDLDAWGTSPDIEVAVTVDRGDAAWGGPVGVVTQLFDHEPIDANHTTAFVCGPEKMMVASSRTLAGRGLLPERIFLSLERHMECGIGLCGHCQMGRFFVCRDGPVFSRRELGEAFEVEGI